MSLLEEWRAARPQPLWLIDPDRLPLARYRSLAEAYLNAGGKWALVGGSFFLHTDMRRWCEEAVRLAPLPLVLFPGSPLQLTPAVQAVLFLFLASGRNPYYLIGAHVEAAPLLHQWGIEVLPTTYILISTGAEARTVHYITQTLPIPADKPELVQATALAGQLLGQKVIYVDAGSGAAAPPPPGIVEAIRAVSSAPLLVGGGIRTPEAAQTLFAAGASFTVIGTATENPAFSRTAWEEFFAICPS